VVRVARQTESRDFAVDARSARMRRPRFLEHDEGRTFARNESVVATIERTARASRVFGTQVYLTRRLEAFQSLLVEQRLVTPGHGDVGPAKRDPDGGELQDRPPLAALAVVLAVAPFVLPRIGASFDLMQRVLVIGILGLGFDLLFGAAGMLSFGQAAFFGTGGMVSAYLLVNSVIGSVWLALAVGTLCAGLFGLLVGWLAVRRIGIYFAMITLAFGQMAYFLSFSPLSDYSGGENGLPGVPFPYIGGYRIVAGLPMYCLLTALFFLGFVLARRILHSPFGAVLRAIK